MRTQAPRRDRIFCIVAAVLLAVLYVAAIAVLKSFDLARAGRIAVALAPLPFFAAFLVAEIRVLRRLDYR